MKRMMILLALALLMALGVSAQAEGMVLPYSEVLVNVEADLLVGTRGTQKYLCTASGQELAGPYARLERLEGTSACYEITREAPINRMGALGAQGQMIVPMQYEHLRGFGDDWLAGIMVEEAGEGAEMTLENGMKVRVTGYDVYYRGQLVFHAEGNAFYRNISGLPACQGKYLVFQTMDKSLVSLSPDGTLTTFDLGSLAYAGEEFSTDGRNIHFATNQPAFTAGCTLRPEDVMQSVMYDPERGFVDLQGEVLNPALPGVRVTWVKTAWHLTDEATGLQGLADKTGRIVLEPRYTEICVNYPGTQLLGGIQLALDGTALRFFDQNGQEMVSVENLDRSQILYGGFAFNSSFVRLRQGEKGWQIITAKKGVLPDLYEDCLMTNPGDTMMAVKQNGKWGVIDLDGSVVVDFQIDQMPMMMRSGNYVIGKVNGIWRSFALK